ncbi:preprotein translocase subunit SecE [Buchnera aphidicola (Thelaxes californica)]|uniref:Protein translocase subunit SecE n=1 Tax=Buchnera aphidicola (Thelaxes californica) TaxID=1315998 RepID=A0A4D6YKU0_9GAMM|nr:preprotein translocase subunit SecE [Buchnera aphidicola (Thelaxes californica)]
MKNRHHRKKNKKMIIPFFLKGLSFISFFLTCIVLHILHTNIYIYILCILFGLLVFFMSFFMTNLGKTLKNFIDSVNNERKKIVYPNYWETLYVTFIIIAITIFISLILWGLDNLSFYLISYIIMLRI